MIHATIVPCEAMIREAILLPEVVAPIVKAPQRLIEIHAALEMIQKIFPATTPLIQITGIQHEWVAKIREKMWKEAIHKTA